MSDKRSDFFSVDRFQPTEEAAMHHKAIKNDALGLPM